MKLSLQTIIGFGVLPLYLLATIVVGWLSRRNRHSAGAFLNSRQSLPLPVVTAAYIAANCGAQEVIGMSAVAAQYGVQALQFYFIGAIPAMVFLALWMMPVYASSGVASVPAYIEQRFGAKMRLLNACVSGGMMLLLGGVSLYAMAQVLAVLTGFAFSASVLLFAAVVLTYVMLGGLRATIYNEMLQLAVMLAGLVPLTASLLHSGALKNLSGNGSRFHMWKGMPLLDRGAQGDAIGWIVGLGFVLSFNYWCTDFVLMQRAFTAKTTFQARQIPLFAGFGKIVFSMIVVLPGLAAMRLIPGLGSTVRADQTLPAVMKLIYGPALLGIGVTAITASLMSGLAANASGFASIWTEEIYRPFLRPSGLESHYITVGRMATVVCIAISAIASYLNFLFGNLMEHVQLIFSIAGAPFWAIFLLGMGSRRFRGRDALAGFCSGMLASLLVLLATIYGWLPYANRMNADLHIAIVGFGVAFAASYCSNWCWPQQEKSVASSLVIHWRLPKEYGERTLWFLAAALLLVCALLNFYWW